MTTTAFLPGLGPDSATGLRARVRATLATRCFTWNIVGDVRVGSPWVLRSESVTVSGVGSFHPPGVSGFGDGAALHQGTPHDVSRETDARARDRPMHA